jgi:hypothetical protein
MKWLTKNPTAILLTIALFLLLNACQKDILTKGGESISDPHIVPEYFARTVAKKFNGEAYFKNQMDTARTAENEIGGDTFKKTYYLELPEGDVDTLHLDVRSNKKSGSIIYEEKFNGRSIDIDDQSLQYVRIHLLKK